MWFRSLGGEFESLAFHQSLRSRVRQNNCGRSSSPGSHPSGPTFEEAAPNEGPKQGHTTGFGLGLGL